MIYPNVNLSDEEVLSDIFKKLSARNNTSSEEATAYDTSNASV